MASKLEKIVQFQSISILAVASAAIDDRKQFQCRKIVFTKKKPDHYFWDSIDAKTPFRNLHSIEKALSRENYKPLTMRPNRFMGRCT